MATTPAVGKDRWKSPLLSPLLFCDDVPFLHAANNKTTTVNIPHSGWFAVCLTTRVGEGEGEEEDDDDDDDDALLGGDHERNHRREAKAGMHLTSSSSSTDKEENNINTNLHLELRIQLPSHWNSSADGKEMISVPLEPLQDKEGRTIFDVGQLYYFVENSSVSLAVHSNNSNKTKATRPNNFQWYLVSRMLEDCNTLKDEKNPQPGSRCQGKKSLLCPTCHKLMLNVRAAVSHRQARHKEDVVAVKNNTQEQNNSNDSDQEDSSTPFPESLEVVYQDDCLAVVNKPQGIAVMGGKRNLHRSDLFLPLAGPIVRSNTTTSIEGDDDDEEEYLRKPMFVHRLDAGTGGLLVLAKTKEVERELKHSFAKRTCQKRYRALVLGRLEPKQGEIDLPMNGNKPTVTRYQVHQYHATFLQDKKAKGWVTVVDLFPETGRKHQLRKHMKAVGHPIWGDKRYGGFLPTDFVVKTSSAVPGQLLTRESDKAENTRLVSLLMSRLCLWALELTLPHPVTKQKLHFSLEDPEWLDFVVQNCAPSFKRGVAEGPPLLDNSISSS